MKNKLKAKLLGGMALLGGGAAYYLRKFKPDWQSRQVAGYYDRWHERYMRVYGKTIQAWRPENEADLLNYIMQSADLRNGLQIIDAGCGVCGPATHFAQHAELKIDALTVSGKQAEEGRNAVDVGSLNDKITVTCGDYHYLGRYFTANSYDRVLFLESLGHAARPDLVIQSAYDMLKPEGCVYIKDFYFKHVADRRIQAKINTVIKRINTYYNYQTLDLEKTITHLRNAGFEIEFIRRFGFESDVSVRFKFEDDFGIDLYEGMTEFAPAEWLEIKCSKPAEWNLNTLYA